MFQCDDNLAHFSPKVMKLGEIFAPTGWNINSIATVNSTIVTAILYIFDALLMVPSCIRKS